MLNFDYNGITVLVLITRIVVNVNNRILPYEDLDVYRLIFITRDMLHVVVSSSLIFLHKLEKYLK